MDAKKVRLRWELLKLFYSSEHLVWIRIQFGTVKPETLTWLCTSIQARTDEFKNSKYSDIYDHLRKIVKDVMAASWGGLGQVLTIRRNVLQSWRGSVEVLLRIETVETVRYSLTKRWSTYFTCQTTSHPWSSSSGTTSPSQFFETTTYFLEDCGRCKPRGLHDQWEVQRLVARKGGWRRTWRWLKLTMIYGRYSERGEISIMCSIRCTIPAGTLLCSALTKTNIRRLASHRSSWRNSPAWQPCCPLSKSSSLPCCPLHEQILVALLCHFIDSCIPACTCNNITWHELTPRPGYSTQVNVSHI